MEKSDKNDRVWYVRTLKSGKTTRQVTIKEFSFVRGAVRQCMCAATRTHQLYHSRRTRRAVQQHPGKRDKKKTENADLNSRITNNQSPRASQKEEEIKKIKRLAVEHALRSLQRRYTFKNPNAPFPHYRLAKTNSGHRAGFCPPSPTGPAANICIQVSHVIRGWRRPAGVAHPGGAWPRQK